jgi:hypothetical protein
LLIPLVEDIELPPVTLQPAPALQLTPGGTVQMQVVLKAAQ